MKYTKDKKQYIVEILTRSTSKEKTSVIPCQSNEIAREVAMEQFVFKKNDNKKCVINVNKKPLINQFQCVERL